MGEIMRQNSFEIKKRSCVESSKYIAGERIAITGAANEKTWKCERGDQEFSSIFPTINPRRLLQGVYVWGGSYFLIKAFAARSA